jgi:hypothetical protein
MADFGAEGYSCRVGGIIKKQDLKYYGKAIKIW